LSVFQDEKVRYNELVVYGIFIDFTDLNKRIAINLFSAFVNKKLSGRNIRHIGAV